MKFSINDFFSKCDQIHSHSLKKSLIENFIFCAVTLLMPEPQKQYKDEADNNKISWNKTQIGKATHLVT